MAEMVSMVFEVELAVRKDKAIDLEKEFEAYLEAFDEIGAGRALSLHDLNYNKTSLETFDCSCELCEIESECNKPRSIFE